MPDPWGRWAGDGSYILFANHQNGDWPILLPAIIKRVTGLPLVTIVVIPHIPLPHSPEPSFIDMEDEYHEQENSRNFGQENDPASPQSSLLGTSWKWRRAWQSATPREQRTPRNAAQTVRELPKSRMTDEPELSLGLETVKNTVDSYMEALLC